MSCKEIKVSVIIVSYNTCGLLRDCLLSVFEKTKDISFEVIVSDNGSVDGSIEMLRAEFPQVVLVENKANLGFGTANNRGHDAAKGEFVFDLNSDTLLLNNAVKIFYDYWRSNENLRLGALGCNLVDSDGLWTDSFGRFPNVVGLLKKMTHHLVAFEIKNLMKFFKMDISILRKWPVYQAVYGEVDFVTGADLFMKRRSDQSYDEKFFLYYEETDLQLQMRKSGLISAIIDGPQINHLIRGGLPKEDDVIRYGTFSIIQSEISKVRYTKKNLSLIATFLLKCMISIQWLSPYIFRNTKKYFKTLWAI